MVLLRHCAVNVATLRGAHLTAGDRTKDSLLEFAEALVPSAGQPHRYVKGVTRITKTPGCNLSGDAQPQLLATAA